jgi:hypothetical protein
MIKRKSHALWNDNTLELPATITVTKPDLTVPTGSQLLRREHEKPEKEATKINANKSKTKYEKQKQEISDLEQSERNKRNTLAELMLQVKTIESDIETTSTNLNNKQSTIIARLKEAIADMKECEDIKTKTALKELEAAAQEFEEQSAELAFSKSSILIEAHRDIGLSFTHVMKTYFDYKSGESNVSLSSTIDAILYVFFDLPFFFSKDELETFLGYAPDNKHVTGALRKMAENEMIVKQGDSNGTIQYYYLGNIANQMLQRHVMPVVGSITGVYSESITIRTRKGRKEIEKQKGATLPTTSTGSPSKKKQSSDISSSSDENDTCGKSNQLQRNGIEESGDNDKNDKTSSKVSLVGRINDELNA